MPEFGANPPPLTAICICCTVCLCVLSPFHTYPNPHSLSRSHPPSPPLSNGLFRSRLYHSTATTATRRSHKRATNVQLEIHEPLNSAIHNPKAHAQSFLRYPCKKYWMAPHCFDVLISSVMWGVATWCVDVIRGMVSPFSPPTQALNRVSMQPP